MTRFPLSGPGLHRVIAQGGLGPLRFWWLPPDEANPHARLLLWDGVNVGISDPRFYNQSFVPLNESLFCSQVLPAPDGHAFACGQQDPRRSATLVQSLSHLQEAPLMFEGVQGPFAWSPDSSELAGVSIDDTASPSTCSVVTFDAAHPGGVQTPLMTLPFVQPAGTAASLCPVLALAWSPDGTRLALSLASEQGVTIDVARLDSTGQPPAIETQTSLPGVAVQLLDSPEVPSLFWSPDGGMLAALSGNDQALEDDVYLLQQGQSRPMTRLNLVDTGSGAALAWSPDGRWLAVGGEGSDRNEDNARLRVYDRQQNTWRTVATMYVGGPTLAWSANGAQLAAASAAYQGIALWNWPSGTLGRVLPNQDVGQLEQLGWAQDNSHFFFTVGSHDTTPFYEELYAQTIPVPTDTGVLPYPDWFVDLLTDLQQWLIGLGAVLIGLVMVMLFLALTGYGRSPRRRRERRRALILWTLGVSAFLFGALLFSFGHLPYWGLHLYQPYSRHLCQGRVLASCDSAASLVLVTLFAPLALGVIVVVLGTLYTSRRHSLRVGGGVWPKRRHARDKPPGSATPLPPSAASAFTESDLAGDHEPASPAERGAPLPGTMAPDAGAREQGEQT